MLAVSGILIPGMRFLDLDRDHNVYLSSSIGLGLGHKLNMGPNL